MFTSFSSIDWDTNPTRQGPPAQTLTQGILGKLKNYLILFLHKDVWKYKWNTNNSIALRWSPAPQYRLKLNSFVKFWTSIIFYAGPAARSWFLKHRWAALQYWPVLNPFRGCSSLDAHESHLRFHVTFPLWSSEAHSKAHKSNTS